MKTRIGELIRDLIAAARQQKLYNAEICRRAGLHVNTLRYFPGFASTNGNDKGEWRPTVRVLERMELVLLHGKTFKPPRRSKKQTDD